MSSADAAQMLGDKRMRRLERQMGLRPLTIRRAWTMAYSQGTLARGLGHRYWVVTVDHRHARWDRDTGETVWAREPANPANAPLLCYDTCLVDRLLPPIQYGPPPPPLSPQDALARLMARQEAPA